MLHENSVGVFLFFSLSLSSFSLCFLLSNALAEKLSVREMAASYQ